MARNRYEKAQNQAATEYNRTSTSDRSKAFYDFENQCQKLKHVVCICCRCTSINLHVISKGKNEGFCDKCKPYGDKDYFLNRGSLPVWWKDGVPMYRIPPELSCLSHAEKLLIQRVSPFVPLHHIKEGLMGLKGHVCAFEQDVEEFMNTLPRSLKDVTVIKVLKTIQTEVGSDKPTRTDAFKVRRHQVLEALQFLKKYNKVYHDIEIDESRLGWIDGDVGDLEGFVIDESAVEPGSLNTTKNSDMGPSPRVTIDTEGDGTFLPTFGYVDMGGRCTVSTKDKNINDVLQECVSQSPKKKEITVDWPAVSTTPVNEYSQKKIFALAFPWLFPGGEGDVRDYPGSNKEGAWGKHLLYYEDGRFARDKIFSFYALNYITRMRNNSSGKWFVDKFQQNCPETLGDLKESIEKGDTKFVNSLTYYNKRVRGSSAYWYQKRSELYTWINHHVERGNGAPTFFITLSCAEHFWPDIIDLISERMTIADDPNRSDCYVGSPKIAQILNDYSIVVQEYFQRRVEIWLKSVGAKVFGIKHYWVRYEFAPGRGQIHAHLLAISDFSDIYRLCHDKLREINGEDKRAQIIGQWAADSFGLTAEVMDGFDSLGTNKLNTPVQIRFSDVDPSDAERDRDVQCLMDYCQTHDCSKFCLRKTNDKRYVFSILFIKRNKPLHIIS